MNRLISVRELRVVAIKHLVELSVEHELFCHFFSKRKTCHVMKYFLWSFSPFRDQRSGSVVERPLCDWGVVGSIPCRVIPKTLKMVLAALSLGAQH